MAAGSALALAALAALSLVQLQQCRAEPSRGRGAPPTTTPAPPPLPGAVDLTRAINGSEKVADHPATSPTAGPASDPASCAGRASNWSRIEAPRRLNSRGWAVDALPLDRLLATGVLLDVAGEAANSTSFVLTASHLEAWEKKNGQLPVNSVLLIRFGWRNASRGPEGPQPPGVSQDAATRLVKQDRIVGVGVDLPALESGKDEPAAKVLMGKNIYTLLNLNLTKELPAKGFALLVLPAKAHGASAASVRVVATPRSPLLTSKSSAARGAAAPLSGVLRLALLAAACLASWPRP